MLKFLILWKISTNFARETKISTMSEERSSTIESEFKSDLIQFWTEFIPRLMKIVQKHYVAPAVSSTLN